MNLATTGRADLQQALLLHGEQVGARRVPRRHLHLVVHLERLLVVVVLGLRQQELLAVACEGIDVRWSQLGSIWSQ